MLELLLLELEALARGGDVDQGAADLGDLLEHLLVGEIEHLVGLLGGVERLVRLGLRRCRGPAGRCPCLPPWTWLLGRRPDASRRMRPPGATIGGQEPEAAMIDPLRWVPDISPSLGASPKVVTLPCAVTTQ